MAESIASELAGKVLEYIVSAAVERITPYFGGSDQLERLEDTMRLIQSRLIDAEARQEEEHGGAAVKEWLRRLKRVLYKLEDLFEEVNMDDREKQQMDGCMLAKPVCLFTSELGRLKMNKKVCQDVKSITRDLESIKSDMALLNLRELPIQQQHVLHQFNFNHKRETYSYIDEKEVIGRESDRKAVVEMLLHSESHQVDENIQVIPIVGIGGIGKTALAQLCYNDKNVEQHFELKAWACISVICSLKELVTKVLISFSGNHDCRKMNMEELQICLRGVINAKRYLLVLDDVWDEDRKRWLKLKSLLSGGGKGSKIVVTTRSPIVANDAMGITNPYQLQCLSEDESRNLFESLAFRNEERNTELTTIGREIVKKCVNVPLAIRTIASLLYSKQTKHEWECFKDELKMIDNNDIMSTLKVSYDHLPSHLKQCFAYCSLFPKEYELEKEHVLWLWMAQGFIRPSENRSLKEVADEYFMELLRRCFFQDVIRAENGSIEGCKMHELFHDLACKVGDECQLVYQSKQMLRDNGLRHVSFCNDPLSSSEAQLWPSPTKQMRSMVLVCEGSSFYRIHNSSIFRNIIKFCSNCRYLRALDLGIVELEIIPNFIWKLKHLRYLRLSCIFENPLPRKPNRITNLQNLQILCLGGGFVKLSNDFTKLTGLRHLIFDDEMGIHLPPKFGELTSLQTLSKFVVDRSNGLDALGQMENLAGELKIEFRERRRNTTSEAVRANLKAKKLTSLNLLWRVYDTDQNALEGLDPPPSLKELIVRHWKGVDFPCLGRGCSNNGFPSLLPNLVSIKIVCCLRCKNLPCLSQLPLLKYLSLRFLVELEYIENWGDNNNGMLSSDVYFPSLEEVELKSLLVLKGWSRSRGGDNGQHHYRSLPRLSKLTIKRCPRLEWMPQVPSQGLSVAITD